MKNPLLGRRILIITAHPDDEAFLCAGAAYQNYQTGGVNALVCATLGEKGSSHMRRPVTPAQLKKIRRRELMSGAKTAKIDTIHCLGFPDGGLPERRQRFFKHCVTFARRWKPELILTFGPDGLTGHVCHIACWQTGKDLAKKLKIPMYTFTVPPQVRHRVLGWLMARRKNPHYQKNIPAYARATVKIPMPAGFKLRVLRHYKSQLLGHDPFWKFPKYAIKLFTAAEYFAKEKI